MRSDFRPSPYQPRYVSHTGVITKFWDGTWTEQTIVYECTNTEDVDCSHGKIAAQYRVAQRIVTKKFVRTKYKDESDVTIWDSERPKPGQRCRAPKQIYLKRVK